VREKALLHWQETEPANVAHYLLRLQDETINSEQQEIERLLLRQGMPLQPE